MTKECGSRNIVSSLHRGFVVSSGAIIIVEGHVGFARMIL